MDFTSALRLNPKLATALYGLGLAKLKKGDKIGASDDIAAAKAMSPNVVSEFERYRVE